MTSGSARFLTRPTKAQPLPFRPWFRPTSRVLAPLAVVIALLPSTAQARPLVVSKETSVLIDGRSLLVERGEVLLQAERYPSGFQLDHWSRTSLPNEGKISIFYEGSYGFIDSAFVKDITKIMRFSRLKSMALRIRMNKETVFPPTKPVRSDNMDYANMAMWVKHLFDEIVRRKGQGYADRLWWNCCTREWLAEAQKQGRLLPERERRALCGR